MRRFLPPVWALSAALVLVGVASFAVADRQALHWYAPEEPAPTVAPTPVPDVVLRDEPPEAVCSALLTWTSASAAANRKAEDAYRNTRTIQERRIVLASMWESFAVASDDAARRLEAVAAGTTSTWASSVWAAAGDLRHYAQELRRVNESLLEPPADRSPATPGPFFQRLHSNLGSAKVLLSSLDAIAEAADDSPDCRRLRTVAPEGLPISP